jgi:hypothetical protein
MIIFQWFFNALIWTRDATLCLFKWSTEDRSHEFEKRMIKHIESQALLFENSNRICEQLIEVLGRQRQETEYKTPVVKSVLKPLVPYTFTNYRVFYHKKALSDYLLECLRINGTSISWTNEYGLHIIDSSLIILASCIREASLESRRESDDLENIQFFLNDLVLLTKEGQKILRECLPLCDDVFRFVLLKYL